MTFAARRLLRIFAASAQWLRQQQPRVVVTLWGAGVDIGFGGEVPFDG